MTAPILALALRALRNATRRPQFLAPLVLFPSLLLAVNTGGLARTAQLPGFPRVHGFLDFQLAAAMSQSLLLVGVTAGIATALELESGFFDRLVASPIPRTAIVLGRLTASAVLAACAAAFFLTLGLVFGAHVAGGVPGALIVLALAALTGMGLGAIGVALALRAGNASTVQGIFPLVFVVLFLSSAFFPRHLLSEPARSVAAYNPLSYIADGLRAPIVEGIAWRPVLEGAGAAAGVAVVALGLCVVTLRGRLRSA